MQKFNHFFIAIFSLIAFQIEFINSDPGRIRNSLLAKRRFSYQAAILSQKGWIFKDSFWCSGSIIARNWILTAASCYHEDFTMTIYVGRDERSDDGQGLECKEFITHKSQRLNQLNNIGLIRTDNIDFTNTVRPIQLIAGAYRDQRYSNEDRRWFCSGWGYNETILRAIEVRTVIVPDCFITSGDLRRYSGLMCAIAESSARVGKVGEPGAPFVYRSDTELIQFGVVYRVQDKRVFFSYLDEGVMKWMEKKTRIRFD